MPTTCMDRYQIVTKSTPTFYFIGVTTGQSSIMNLFPLWMEEVDRPEAVIEGVDHKPHDDPERYRQTVAQIKCDPLSLGALVTTHKIDLLEAARDMFDYLDPYAQITAEVSSISKRDGALEGHAKDPIAAGLSLDAILGEAYFARTGGEVLCLGAGGAGTAIALHLMAKERPGDRPRRFVAVDISAQRLDKLRRMVESHDTDVAFEFIHNHDPRRNDNLLGALPAGSVVINATGMGKDRPGSPVTAAGTFPENGIIWELNYRGELDFMHQALAQQDARRLRVEDGWLYFLHGWTQVIAQVLHITVDEKTFTRLAKIAAAQRTS